MQWIWCAITKKSWIVRYREDMYQRIHFRERLISSHRRCRNLSQIMTFLFAWFWLNLKWSFQQRLHWLRLRFRFRKRLSFCFADFRDCCCRLFKWINRMNTLTKTSAFFLLDEQIVMIIMIMAVKTFDRYLPTSKSFREAFADCFRSYSRVISGWKKRWAVYLVYKHSFLVISNSALLFFLLIAYDYAAASCFNCLIKQQFSDCCSNDLVLGRSFYILRSFLLYLLCMLLVLVNLYSYDLSLCWPWHYIGRF